MGENTRARHRAHRTIDDALREYHGPESYADVPADLHSANCAEKLTQKHVTQAVTAMTLYLGLCGSVGRIDLYELLTVALLHPEKHPELESVLRGAKTTVGIHPKTGNGLATARPARGHR
jgi:hypothetical protein